MENLKLNETPVRTSRNFNINNIKLENINIPDNIECFENVTITGENPQIENVTSDIKLVYGLGDFLTNQVKAQANQKLKIEIDSKTNKETQIEFKFDDENLALLEDIEIIANENTKATIIIKYLSDAQVQAYHNGILRVNAKKDSNINIIIVNLMNSNSDNFMAIENIFEENAKVNYCIIDFGGKNSITNYYSNLLGEKSENTINTIYLGKENQLFDLNYIGELRGEKSNIDIEVQGA
jgi:Fe-S cluster assembly scaffold protein SufB